MIISLVDMCHHCSYYKTIDGYDWFDFLIWLVNICFEHVSNPCQIRGHESAWVVSLSYRLQRLPFPQKCEFYDDWGVFGISIKFYWEIFFVILPKGRDERGLMVWCLCVCGGGGGDVKGFGAAEATGLGFVCFFVVINPCVLSANRVDFGLFFCFINFQISPPPPAAGQYVFGAFAVYSHLQMTAMNPVWGRREKGFTP